jgi:hypothetical protein
LCAGCAGGPPAWVERPAVDGGLAATECVRDSGKLSLDRQVALSKARAGVTAQLERRARALDTAWAGLKPAGAGGGLPTAAAPFSLAARSVAEQMLAGLEPERVEYVEFEDVRHLCAMVTVPAGQMRPLFDRLLQASATAPGAEAAEALYAAFIAVAAPAD